MHIWRMRVISFNTELTMKVLISLLLLATIANCHVLSDNSNGDTWAVLIAGSDGYFNYRHQADVCHAYQILKGHGIPDDRIIVFMQDDIANNQENPKPGKLFNRPDGPDVYHGVPKDYTKDNYTLANLWSVLSGEEPKSGSGKTLKSTKNDNVFLFYADHGAPGLSGFCDETLMATKLNKAIKAMHTNGMYNQMVIYWESCESGSMFAKGLLPSDINVLAVTAANTHESSYACYEDSTLNTFLGDVFSVRWMEDSDRTGDLAKESIGKQVTTVTKETNTSHVQTYGDKGLEKLHLSSFMGKKAMTPQKFPQKPCFNRVSQQDVPIYVLLERAWRASNNAEADKHFNQARELKAARKAMTDKVKELLKPYLKEDEFVTNYLTTNEMSVDQMTQCYYPLVEAFDASCYKLGCNNYAYRAIRYFTDLCVTDKFNTVDKYVMVNNVIASMKTTCNVKDRNSVCGIE